MIRIQVSLDEKEHKLAKMAAQKQGISLAEYIRRAIRQAQSAPWMKYAGMVSGDPNSSESIDEIAYDRSAVVR